MDVLPFVTFYLVAARPYVLGRVWGSEPTYPHPFSHYELVNSLPNSYLGEVVNPHKWPRVGEHPANYWLFWLV